MTATRYDYHGMIIIVLMAADGLSGKVQVFAPVHVFPMFETTSLDIAMRWIDGLVTA